MATEQQRVLGLAVTKAWRDYCHASETARKGDEYERGAASHAMGYYHAMRDAYLSIGGRMGDLPDASTWRDVADERNGSGTLAALARGE